MNKKCRGGRFTIQTRLYPLWNNQFAWLSSLRSSQSLRRPAITQCHRCQGFGHLQNCCYEIPRCVKCGLNHLTSDCTRPKMDKAKDDNDPPSCVNCGKPGHPANWVGCPNRPDKLSIYLDQLILISAILMLPTIQVIALKISLHFLRATVKKIPPRFNRH